jgi:hypothetical protein
MVLSAWYHSMVVLVTTLSRRVSLSISAGVIPTKYIGIALGLLRQGSIILRTTQVHNKLSLGESRILGIVEITIIGPRDLVVDRRRLTRFRIMWYKIDVISLQPHHYEDTR